MNSSCRVTRPVVSSVPGSSVVPCSFFWSDVGASMCSFCARLRPLLLLILPVLFSVSPVPSCCVCLLHFHLHAQRSCCFIQPYHSKEFIFHKSSLTYSNISGRACSRHVALGDILIRLWKSLLTSSLLVGFCFQRGKQTGTVHNPLSSLSPWQ